MATLPIPGGGSTRVDPWDRPQRTLGQANFSPESQDRAAIELVDEAGALADARAGRFEQAASKERRTWASLPGAGYTQGERSMAWAVGQVQRSWGRVRMNKKLLLIGAPELGLLGVLLYASRRSDGTFTVPGLIGHENPNGSDHHALAATMPQTPAAVHAPAPAPVVRAPAPAPGMRRPTLAVGVDGAQVAPVMSARNPNWIDWR
jgi:hypothetical protein